MYTKRPQQDTLIFTNSNNSLDPNVQPIVLFTKNIIQALVPLL